MIALPYYLVAAVAAVVSLPAQAVRSRRSRRAAAECPSLTPSPC